MRTKEQIEQMLATANAICFCEYPEEASVSFRYEQRVRDTLAWVLNENIPDSEIFDPNVYGLKADA